MRRHKGKRQLKRCRHKGKDYFTTDLKEAELGAIELVDVAQGRDKWQAVVNAGWNFQIPNKATNLQLFSTY
jgi:hypothetical protein